MMFLDVCGPPGSGKSTLCDPLYGPHSIDWEGVETFDPSWEKFLNVCDQLLKEVRDHKHPVTGEPTIEAMFRMLTRSLKKMSVVASLMAPRDEIYTQTALAQRGLGFGWRLFDLGKVELVRRYFEVMPVSLGVVLADAPDNVIEERNHQRRHVAETAHEDRAFMVRRMRPAIQIMEGVFSERRINYAKIDTTRPIEEARAKLVALASGFPRDASAIRPRRKMATIHALP